MQSLSLVAQRTRIQMIIPITLRRSKLVIGHLPRRQNYEKKRVNREVTETDVALAWQVIFQIWAVHVMYDEH